ncbi:MAG: hypothetical protein MJ252_00955 [archaeon]|nr:hypothetical protein [archaeon]
MLDPRFDDLLNTVIQEKGQGIYGFLEVIFSFLYRRTDFFYEMAPGENMGFFPNQAEAIVCGYFRKFQQLHYKERVPKRNIDQKKIEDFINKQKEKAMAKKAENKTNTQSKPPETKKENKTEIKVEPVQQKPTTKTEESKKEEPIIKKEEPKKEEEKPKIPMENKPSSISTYNGDKCDFYNWSQGVTDVTIQVNLPTAVSKKMLDIKMTPSHLYIKLSNSKDPLIDNDFCEKIKPDDSNWTLEEGQALIFFLEKASEVIWKSAFKGGKEIDTKTVDNSKRIDEFDTETQAALKKIVYEQNRKRNGLPTTEEEEKLKQLKEAWEKPGSPFAGQPFDPSMFNLNEPIYFNTPEYEASKRAKEEADKAKEKK